MVICVAPRVAVGNNKESWLFKKYNFVGVYCLAESVER
jgi:hypothetical protein